MSLEDSPLHRLAARLRSRSVLDGDDERGILTLPHTMRIVDPAAYLVREGERPLDCSFIASGFACRQKTTMLGARQIVSLHVPGDILDLQHLFLDCADHSIQALGRAEIAFIPMAALKALVRERPAIAEAFWIEALVDASIFREWIMNVGRRDARTRIAHLLCEFITRMRFAGLAFDGHFRLPMTQEQLGDATGLTPVHVNRTLKILVRDGILTHERRMIGVLDWDALRAAADFETRYLHLQQAAARPA